MSLIGLALYNTLKPNMQLEKVKDNKTAKMLSSLSPT
jgi:hypothetical protein